MFIRPAILKDLEQIHSINESVLPHVNSIPISDFKEFIEISSFFSIVEIEGEIAGFMIVLDPHQNYDSENYSYFKETFTSFDYVDRIVISEEYRGKGLGTKLYQYLFDNSKEERVTCEVNIQPPNPKSILFHQMLGFEEVNQHYSEGGKKFVTLMARNI